MNAAIVDTDVVSMLFKGDSRAKEYRVHLSGRLLGICFMTLAELERWPLERGWGAVRKSELAQHLTKYVVLPATRELCSKWAEVSYQPERASHPDCGRMDRRKCALLRGSSHHEQCKRLRDAWRTPIALGLR
jgi:predicted nucleic acid-binding protein